MLKILPRFVDCTRRASTHWRTLALRAHTLALRGLAMAVLALPSLAQGVSPAVVSTPQLRAELVAHAPQGVQAGQPLWVGLQITHQPGWHTYWRNPGDSGLPTQLELNLPTGITAGHVLWPLPQKLKAGHLTNYGFEKTVLLAVPLTVTQQWVTQPSKPSESPTLDLQLHANWLVCRLECIPQEGDFALRIPINSSFVPQRAAFDALFAQQATALSQLNAQVSFEAQRLVMQVRGLPSVLHGKTLGVFPETAELVDAAAEQHPLAAQIWQGDVWTVKLPLSPLRVTEPKNFDVLLTLGEGDQRLGYGFSSPVTQAWPGVSDMPSTAALAADAPAPDGAATGWVLALLGAFVGGLLLNLMPCVLPVLAIKLFGFAQHSQAVRAHRVAGMAYTAGVVLSFLTLGGAVLALRAAGEQLGWGFQMQSPLVVSVLAVLFTLIALNLIGFFEVGQLLPSRVSSFQARHPIVDALLSGVLAVAVASPCSAPFMGASLGLAMTLPTWQALSIFATLGLGLAAPYAVASFVPAVARWLPRPGPWMNTLRQLLAFPIFATVVWLLWILGLQTHLALVIAALSGLLLLAAFIWALNQPSKAARGLAGIIALAWVVGGMFFLDELNAPMNKLTSQANQNQAQERWQTWSTAAVAQHLAEGRPVFVDFTAAWCVTCQINKQTTLSSEEVLADFAAHQVTLMRADWTRRDPAITAALASLGRNGVPVYVLYVPGKAPLVLSELLSVGKVRAALGTLKTMPADNKAAITANTESIIQANESADMTR